MEQLFAFPDIAWPNPDAGFAAIFIIGMLYCFLGCRILRFLIGLTGFVLAGGAAVALASYLGSGNIYLMIAAGLLGGLAGALALFFVYKVGVFVIAMIGAAVIAHAMIGERSEAWIPIAILGLGFLGGMLGLLIERPVMMLATAVLGSCMMTYGLAIILLRPRLVDAEGPIQLTNLQHGLILGAWGILAALGLWIQMRSYSNKKPPPRFVDHSARWNRG